MAIFLPKLIAWKVWGNAAYPAVAATTMSTLSAAATPARSVILVFLGRMAVSAKLKLLQATKSG